MPAFACHIGIDYSGAETSTSGLKGLRICRAEGEAPPVEVHPPPSAKKYWTRRGIDGPKQRRLRLVTWGGFARSKPVTPPLWAGADASLRDTWGLTRRCGFIDPACGGTWKIVY